MLSVYAFVRVLNRLPRVDLFVLDGEVYKQNYNIKSLIYVRENTDCCKNYIYCWNLKLELK